MKVCIYHISEIFLYEYYVYRNEYEINEHDLVTDYCNSAIAEMNKGNIDLALQEYLKAHMQNPVKYDLYSKIIMCCRQLNDLDGFYNYTLESHKFCCTRAELASYYRNLGYFCLEKYKPQLALDLYTYSKCFYENKNADNEIEYLKAAMGDKIKENSIEEIQENLLHEKIPIMADNITMGLLFRAGEEAESKGILTQALDCYEMVYDLTNDEELSHKIKLLKSELEG